jgi:hypothetical protein
MQQTGYSLIDKDDNIIQSWYENAGMRSKPDFIVLPNGDIVNAPDIYVFYEDYKLVKRFLVNNVPGQWYTHTSSTVVFDGTDVVETYVYPELPNVVPQSVSPLQFRKALNQMNMRTMIEDYVNTLDADSKDAWEYAISFERNNPIIASAAEALDKTTEEVDDLFRLASTL